MGIFSPKETFEKVSDSSIAKGNGKISILFLSGIMAGAFIAFGAEASQMASFNLTLNTDTLGLGKLVSAVVFPVGLMMVVLCGAELFTGNSLMLVGVLDKKIRLSQMLRNWITVYLGNFTGALLMVALISASGLWDTGGGLLGAVVVKTAVSKVNLSFSSAFVLGILCNWMVCMAVWMATAAKDAIGKIAAIFFCIGLFVLSGFEHSVANMYFIPAGIVAAANGSYAALLSLDTSSLTIGNFLLNNLLPVTLGNIVGGTVFVALAYWVVHRKA